MNIHVIAKYVKAYKKDKSIKPKFKPEEAMIYDKRIFSWRKFDAVFILTFNGKTIIPIRIGEYQ